VSTILIDEHKPPGVQHRGYHNSHAEESGTPEALQFLLRRGLAQEHEYRVRRPNFAWDSW
jgi:hypothetical protein